jgi:sugar lactone lactonase YvrE
MHSPDNSKIGLVWNSGLTLDVYYKVLNKDLSDVHQKKYTIKKPGTPQFKSAAVDNDGNIWLAAKGNQETYITCFAPNGMQTEKKLKLNHDNALDVHLGATPGKHDQHRRCLFG